MTRNYDIGPFRLDSETGVLTKAGTPVALGARAVAVLATLVERPNQYVSKAGIMDAAWPGIVVEESNLAVQISALRRVLSQAPGGEHWIETLSRRGYRFVGPITPLLANAEDNDGRNRSNLPEPLTSFVGRERELVEIKRLLPGKRLLTLVGMGGIGKTRLALQAAAEVTDAYRDGVWLVELASISNPSLVPNSVAQVFGVKEMAGASRTDTLCSHLKSRQLLLILDNCEHLIDACATLTDAVLRSAADTTIIATSREPLHVEGEQTYPLQALSLPEPSANAESVARSEAVQLFVERARRHLPDFELITELTPAHAAAVAQLCIHLDGIPLALELAAARIRSLSIEQINARLHNRFRLLTSGNRTLPRQQTLRATLDWSFDLLAENERTVLRRMAVFAGGWTLAAAETVGVGGEVDTSDVLDLLARLVEKSLVEFEAEGARYRLLETVRQYAREMLAESEGSEAVRRRHRDYFLALAEEAAPNLTGAEQAAWLQRLEEEHENLRASLDWSLAEAGSGAGLRLCGALQRFWWMRGHLSEGRAWCARALARAGGGAGTREHAFALNAAGALAFYQGDYAAARARYQESLAMVRELGDNNGIARALNNLGNVHYEEGDYASARARREESLALHRKLGNRTGIAIALNNLGNVVAEQGDYTAARALHEEGLAINRELGDRSGIAISLNNLGDFACEQGDYPAAGALYEEGLAIKRELGDRGGIAISLTGLGNVNAEQGDYPGAGVLYEESLAIRRELGDRRGIAYSLEGLAAVVDAIGSPLRATRIWGAAERLREDIGAPLPPNERPRYDRRVAVVRAALRDDAAFERAWQEGRALTLEQAMELAVKG